MITTLDHKYRNTKTDTKEVYITNNAFLFTIYSSKFIPRSFKELVNDRNKTFTYTHDSEYYIFRILLLSHDIDEEGINIEKNRKGSDVILQYMSKDDLLKKTKQNFTFVNYTYGINIDKLQYMIPFYRFKVVNRIKYLEIDEITYDSKNKNRSSKKELFYTLFFGQNKSNTKEPFNSSVTTKIDYPIEYKVVDKSKDDKYIKLEITNVKFNYKIHDKLLIMNNNNKYNGLFHIVSTDPLIAENKLSYKFKHYFKIIDMRHTFDDDVLHKHPQSRTTLAISKSKDSKAFIPSNQQVWFTDIKQHGYVYDHKDVQAVRIFTDFKTEYDQENVCFGNPSVLNKGACERMGYMWDARCEKNSDCPFYSEDQERGGCTNGYCEVPLGVKHKAYRKYDYENKKGAFCYDCKDPLSPYCCDEKKEKSYVFKGNHFDKTINLELFTTRQNKAEMNGKLYLALKDKDSQFSINKSMKLTDTSPNPMIIELASKRMVKDIKGYSYYNSYLGKFYKKSGNATYFNAYCLLVQDVQDVQDVQGGQGVERGVEVVDFNCLHDAKTDKYMFNNIIIRRTQILYSNLQYLSKKQISEQISQTIDLL